MKDFSNQYIIVTACKNEENSIKQLIDSVASQTLKPRLWVILDDGSTDNTLKILNDVEKELDWIKVIKSKEGVTRDIGLHLSNVVSKGFNFAVKYCRENNIEYDFLSNLDGDLILEPDFFENILKEFHKDQDLGIASGGTRHIIGDKVKIAQVSSEEPSGGHMVIRRKCFEQCGGIPVSYAYDSVLKAKARLRGWKTKRFEENLVTEIRDVGSAEGYWKGYKHKGEASYYLNLHPIHILYKALRYTIDGPFYLGIAFLYGYALSLLKRGKKTSDEEVKVYFRNKWKKYLKNKKNFAR